eukprot:m51a1_g6070 hypothetical protein (248) ;mRNA; r:275189-276113
MAHTLLASLAIILGLSHALLCSNEVGRGCSVWTPGAPGNANCHLNEAVGLNQLVEARVPDNAGSTGFVLVPSNSDAVRLIGNVTIQPPPTDYICTGCPSTLVLFYEATSSGSISVVGRRSFSPSESYEAFALGLRVDVGLQTPACSGGFVGAESSGSTLTVERNSLVEVRLQASPASTGYWWVADPATPVAAEVVLPCRDPEEDGCSQTYVFFFRATQEGPVRVNSVRFGTEIEGFYSINLRFPSSA